MQALRELSVAEKGIAECNIRWQRKTDHELGQSVMVLSGINNKDK